MDSIETFELVERGGTTHDLVINLKKPISEALLADWRSRPLLRRPMRLPWRLASKTEIRIPLDILDKPAEEIKNTFVRMWRYNRAREPGTFRPSEHFPIFTLPQFASLKAV